MTGGHPWLAIRTPSGAARPDLGVPPPAPFPAGWVIPADPDPGAPLAETYMLRTIQALDVALAQHVRERPNPVWLRIWHGVTNHFHSRLGEWIATGWLIQFGWILYMPPDVFATSPNLAVMAQVATEQTWGAICLVIGGLHLAALSINGTFPRFRWSPHIRAASSLVGFFLWFQIVLAIWQSGVGGTGLGTYRLLLLLEGYNFIRACLDTGAIEKRRKADYGQSR